MTLRKFSLVFLFCVVVLGAAVLGWYLLTRDSPEEEIKVGDIGSQSISNGVHMLEGELNNTTVFSGITWVNEVITVVLLLISFVVYKLIHYKCKTPAPAPTADPPAQPPPAAPAPLPLPPQAQQAYQQFYPPPSYSSPFSAQLMADTAAATVKYAKKPKVNVIESESEDETSGSDTTSVVTVPAPVIEKKRKNRPRTQKNHLVTADKENTTA